MHILYLARAPPRLAAVLGDACLCRREIERRARGRPRLLFNSIDTLYLCAHAEWPYNTTMGTVRRTSWAARCLRTTRYRAFIDITPRREGLRGVAWGGVRWWGGAGWAHPQ